MLLILALAARQSRATIIGAFVLALLVTVAQTALAAAATAISGPADCTPWTAW